MPTKPKTKIVKKPKSKTVRMTKVTPQTRSILVHRGEKAFVVDIPLDSKTTFGPWSPPVPSRDKFYGDGGGGRSDGTLRVYGKSKEHVLAVFSGVTGFRDLSLNYQEVDTGMLGSPDEPSDETSGMSIAELAVSIPTSASSEFIKRAIGVPPLDADMMGDDVDEDLPF